MSAVLLLVAALLALGSACPRQASARRVRALLTTRGRRRDELVAAAALPAVARRLAAEVGA
ncbi:MAG: hypothetical protein ABI317_01595, partial [Gaiellales bacterium]